jgi:hypothetical protein
VTFPVPVTPVKVKLLLAVKGAGINNESSQHGPPGIIRVTSPTVNGVLAWADVITKKANKSRIRLFFIVHPFLRNLVLGLLRDAIAKQTKSAIGEQLIFAG